MSKKEIEFKFLLNEIAIVNTKGVHSLTNHRYKKGERVVIKARQKRLSSDGEMNTYTCISTQGVRQKIEESELKKTSQLNLVD